MNKITFKNRITRLSLCLFTLLLPVTYLKSELFWGIEECDSEYFFPIDDLKSPLPSPHAPQNPSPAGTVAPAPLSSEKTSPEKTFLESNSNEKKEENSALQSSATSSLETPPTQIIPLTKKDVLSPGAPASTQSPIPASETSSSTSLPLSPSERLPATDLPAATLPLEKNVSGPSSSLQPVAPQTQNASSPTDIPSAVQLTPVPGTPNAIILQESLPPPAPQAKKEGEKTILINFNNVSIVEFIRFISRISNKNFVFDENDLQFNVTIISEEPTTIDNIMTALLQELRIHDLTLLEQGNNLIIHKNTKVNNISKIIAEGIPESQVKDAEIVTQVFRLNTVDAEKAAAIIRPLTSSVALVEVIKEANQLVITDLGTNVSKIHLLIKSIDSPQNGLVIGQYVVKNGFGENLIQLTQRIMGPIAGDQPLNFISHEAAGSIFIVSTPYLVERTISVMQYVDQPQGTTHILNPQDLKFTSNNGQWELDENGNWRYRSGLKGQGTTPPTGRWVLDENGNWKFIPGEEEKEGKTPEGQWSLDSNGNWSFQLTPGKPLAPERLSRNPRFNQELPVGHIERTQFYIYKLHYRLASKVEDSVRKMADSLRQLGSSNADVVATINSIQAIEQSNSLIFTGPASAIEKVKELIQEVDTPLRQVFLDMLILETTLDDSLQIGVNLATRFGGGNTSGSQSFLSFPDLSTNPLPAALDTAQIGSVPSAINMAKTTGYNLGIIGQHLTMGGLRFNSLGAFVHAIRDNQRVNIVMNPKILTEDNSPAEIFVGETIPYPTQAISNDFGTVLTQNFDYRDVGTRMKVTPLIGNNDVITLDIEEEVSRLITTSNLSSLAGQAGVIPPTTRKNRTTTKVHMPNGYFLIMSGMMQDEDEIRKMHVPCLGGLPIIGAAFGERNHIITKRNLLIFIRPQLIDSEIEMQNLTKRQQDLWKSKNYEKKTWKYEAQEALEYLNIKDQISPDYDINSQYKWGHFQGS